MKPQLAKRLSDRAMAGLDLPDTLQSSMRDVESPDDAGDSHSADELRSDGDCLPLSSDDALIGGAKKSSIDDTSASLPIDGERVLPSSSDASNGKHTDNMTSSDGDCLPFSSEDVHFDVKDADKSFTKSERKRCCVCTRRCTICGVVLLVLTALAVGIGVGLSNKGREAADAAEEWASKYLPGFMGGKGATEDTAGKRDDPTERGSISFWSPAFEYGEPVPIRYTADAGDVSPPLDWSELPEGTKDIVIICEDTDFPHPDRPAAEPFVHWIAYGITSAFGNLPEGIPKEKEVDNIVGTDPATGEQYSLNMFQGITSYGVDIDESDPLNERPVGWGYHGPDPPSGHPPHRYYFRILALDGRIKDHLPSDDFVFMMEDVKRLTEGDDPELNVLGFGVLMGKYQKP